MRARRAARSRGHNDDLTRLRTLYLSHNAVGSALVRGQVIAYLAGLERYGVEADLVTFERDGGSAVGAFPRERWHPVRARAGSSLLAKTFDVARGVALAMRVVRDRRPAIIHARSYVPAAIALLAGLLTSRPYIFDMRGFLGDEYLDAGYWGRRDIRYLVLRLAERWLLARAAHIVVLTEAAARHMRAAPRFVRSVRGTPITAIPCAVDLDRFRPATERAAAPTLVYTGSLGSFYELDPMLEVFRAARRLLPGLRFLIVNRSEHELVRAALSRLGIDDDGVTLRGADFAEMPAIVASAHVGIALMRRSFSKIASSPVKIGEYLACGVPVIVNAGLGDVDVQVRDHGAGHVMDAYTSSDIATAAQAVVRLAGDGTARERARLLAEREYSLDSAIARYAEIYGAVARVRLEPS